MVRVERRKSTKKRGEKNDEEKEEDKDKDVEGTTSRRRRILPVCKEISPRG